MCLGAAADLLGLLACSWTLRVPSTARQLALVAGNSQLWAQKPFYNGYTPLASLFEPRVAWTEDQPVQQSSAVEIVCSPNNPDGRMQTKQLPGVVLSCHAGVRSSPSS